MIKNVKMGKNVKIFYPELVNFYSCRLEDNVKIGPFTEIQAGVTIGARSVISSHAFVCEGVTVENDCFIGHHVCFSNDKYPIANNKDYKMEKTIVRHHASIGNNVTILPGVTIGAYALVGAGATVTKNVPEGAVVIGNPARVIKYRNSKKLRRKNMLSKIIKNLKNIFLKRNLNGDKKEPSLPYPNLAEYPAVFATFLKALAIDAKNNPDKLYEAKEVWDKQWDELLKDENMKKFVISKEAFIRSRINVICPPIKLIQSIKDTNPNMKNVQINYDPVQVTYYTICKNKPRDLWVYDIYWKEEKRKND